MRIRARLTLWFSAVLLVALTVMAVWCYNEFVLESPPAGSRHNPKAKAAEQDENPVVDLVEMLLICGVPALGLALGGGWWLMRKALAPVAALTAAAERIHEHDLGTPLARTGNGDELDRLTDVFNAMTARLNASFVRLREFTLHASHELKTPLTVMHGELETWLRENRLTPEQRQRVESTLDEVQRLAKIVDGLTLLTKADAGQVALAREPVRLDELVREACADAQSLARPAGVEVNLGTCDEVTVTGDRHRLRQLLLNLCDNAVKYNERGGTVLLELRRGPGTAEARVSNSGPGIPPESLARVFEPFFRGDASHSNRIEGSGLGLSIARWIVQSHGGRIEITSEPGKMTTAAVRLSLAGAEEEH